MGLFCQVDIGSKVLLALQNPHIPKGSTSRTIPEWLFLSRFQTKQRLTASRPDTTSIISEGAI